jgi:hypothetical protein
MTVHSYGGIFERGSREYTLDDFYYLQLDKLDRYVCLKPNTVVIPADVEESSSGEDDNSDDDSDSDDSDDDVDTLVARSSIGPSTKGLDNNEYDEQETLEVVAEEEASDKVTS